MALKTFNPTSPGRRQLVLVDKSDLHKGKPVKALTEGLTKSGGRNNKGRITARRIGRTYQNRCAKAYGNVLSGHHIRRTSRRVASRRVRTAQPGKSPAHIGGRRDGDGDTWLGYSEWQPHNGTHLLRVH